MMFLIRICRCSFLTQFGSFFANFFSEAQTYYPVSEFPVWARRPVQSCQLILTLFFASSAHYSLFQLNSQLRVDHAMEAKGSDEYSNMLV